MLAQADTVLTITSWPSSGASDYADRHAGDLPRNVWISASSGPALGIIRDSELWRLFRARNKRHSFAVGRLLRWYRDGGNPADHLMKLSTFMGHVDPISTAVYLTITTDLMEAAGLRFERFAAPISTRDQP